MPPSNPDDPRSIITPDAFQVSPELLGLPLAGPWRRLVALLADLLLIAILSQLGGTALALTALVFFVFAARREKAGPEARSAARGRVMVGCLAALIILVAVPALVGIIALVQNRGAVTQVVQGVSGLAGLDRLSSASGPEEAHEAALSVADGMRRLGVPSSEIERVLQDGMPDSAWADSIVQLALASPGPASAQAAGPAEGAAAPGAVGLSPAIPPGDTQQGPGGAGVDTTLEGIPALTGPSADSLRALEDRVEGLVAETSRLRERNREAEEALAELRNQEPEGFLMRIFRNVFEDLGLAFGFGTIYLTVFTAWWSGRTPGKRLLGIRVLRLDGRPITWWDAFERAGGYAAGFATGLLGFAQIFWDSNRQAIHDRISATVVVLDGRPPVPGRWRSAVDLDPGREVRLDFREEGSS